MQTTRRQPAQKISAYIIFKSAGQNATLLFIHKIRAGNGLYSCFHADKNPVRIQARFK